jgi:hypothetical protein
VQERERECVCVCVCVCMERGRGSVCIIRFLEGGREREKMKNSSTKRDLNMFGYLCVNAHAAGCLRIASMLTRDPSAERANSLSSMCFAHLDQSELATVTLQSVEGFVTPTSVRLAVAHLR